MQPVKQMQQFSHKGKRELAAYIHSWLQIEKIFTLLADAKASVPHLKKEHLTSKQKDHSRYESLEPQLLET